MSVGDVRGKDMSELARMIEDYMSRGRVGKARTLMQALMLEDRSKVQQLLARLPGFREELQELCQRWVRKTHFLCALTRCYNALPPPSCDLGLLSSCSFLLCGVVWCAGRG